MEAVIREARETPISHAFGIKFPPPERFAALKPEDQRVGILLAREAGVRPPVEAASLRPAMAMPAPPLRVRDFDTDLGVAAGQPFGFDLARLLDGRLLVQGTSGAGKSWTLRRIIEQTADSVQQVIIDPEGEFSSIPDKYTHTRIEAHKLDSAALAVLATRIRAHRLSVVVDMSEMDRDGQLQGVSAIFDALINAPRTQWSPCLVVVDEAHLFAPFGGQSAATTAVRKAAIGAVVDLMSRGRKRGLAGVLATQRLARLSKSVASEVHNFLVGMNTLDLDIRRAAETIGWDASKAFDKLPGLSPGDFIAVGPAFNRSPSSVRIGPVRTHHKGARPELIPPTVTSDATGLLEINALIEASAADGAIRDEAAMAPVTRAVRAFLREPSAAVAARITAELRAIAPAGAAIADLPVALSVDAGDVMAALALLDSFGVVEFGGDAARTVRVAKGMV